MCLAVGTFTPRELRDDPPRCSESNAYSKKSNISWQSRGINRNLEDYKQQTQPRSNPCSCKHVRPENLTEVYRLSGMKSWILSWRSESREIRREWQVRFEENRRAHLEDRLESDGDRNRLDRAPSVSEDWPDVISGWRVRVARLRVARPPFITLLECIGRCATRLRSRSGRAKKSREEAFARALVDVATPVADSSYVTRAVARPTSRPLSPSPTPSPSKITATMLLLQLNPPPPP